MFQQAGQTKTLSLSLSTCYKMYFEYFKRRFCMFFKTQYNISIVILIPKLLALPLKIDVIRAICRGVTHCSDMRKSVFILILCILIIMTLYISD